MDAEKLKDALFDKMSAEQDQYRASHQTNIACKEAVETAIGNHHDGFSFDSKAAVRDVAQKFGYERTLYVLAATMRSKEWDGRFSSQNKDWARTIPVFEDKTSFGGDRNMEFAVQSHSVLTDVFLTTAPHEHLLSLPLTKEDIKAEALNILRKTSVRKKLQEKSSEVAAPKPPKKNKTREQER